MSVFSLCCLEAPCGLKFGLEDLLTIKLASGIPGSPCCLRNLTQRCWLFLKWLHVAVLPVLHPSLPLVVLASLNPDAKYS